MGNPDEEQMRKSAVERYLAGTSASDTCSEIDLIRFIRSDLQPNVCGKKFKMPKKLMYEYIVASVPIRLTQASSLWQDSAYAGFPKNFTGVSAAVPR